MQKLIFLKMKCHSLLPKDIDKHIKRTSERFHMLNGIMDPSLKHVYLSSFPDELQNDIDWLIRSTKRAVSKFGLGELSQIILEALHLWCDKNVATKRFFKQRKIVNRVYKNTFDIGCKTHKECDCRSTKKSKPQRPVHLPCSSRRRQKIRFFKKRFQRKKRSNLCYLCKKPRHFARNCPTKKKKSVHMVSQLLVDYPESDIDIESLYSEQRQPDQEIVFAVTVSDSDNNSQCSFDEEEEHSSPVPIFTCSNYSSLSF
jgi:hypothetical protein